MARRATVIGNYRRASRHFLLLEAGDSWYGEGQLGHQTQGKIVVEAMNHLGYDAMTLGELEFGLGLEELRRRVEEAAFPVVSANVVSTEGEKPLLAPYVVREMGGHQIALIGLMTTDADEGIRRKTGDAYRVSDPFVAAHKYVAELAGRCDIIIVLSHLGVDQDQALAREIPEIDVIVGGHSMKVLQPALQEPPNNTVILQAGYRGEWIGYAQLHFDATGKVVRFENQVMVLGPEVEDNPEMQALLDKYGGG
ncbi:MAG: bifunctional metallophosphatase/5'-nucleotidase [Anaerolineae bacterium]